MEAEYLVEETRHAVWPWRKVQSQTWYDQDSAMYVLKRHKINEAGSLTALPLLYSKIHPAKRWVSLKTLEKRA